MGKMLGNPQLISKELIKKLSRKFIGDREWETRNKLSIK